MKLKTIGVIGAGPVGGILAAHLLSAGHDVMIIDSWREHIERIRTVGLKITGREELTVRPVQLSPMIGALDSMEPDFVGCGVAGNERQPETFGCCFRFGTERY